MKTICKLQFIYRNAEKLLTKVKKKIIYVFSKSGLYIKKKCFARLIFECFQYRYSYNHCNGGRSLKHSSYKKNFHIYFVLSFSI